MKQLSSIKMTQQLSGSPLNVVRSSKEAVAKLAYADMLLAGALVCMNCIAQASPLVEVRHVDQQGEVVALDPLSVGAQVFQFAPQTGPGRIGDVVELLPASQLHRAPEIQLRPEDSAETQASKREGPRVRVGEDVNFMDHYPGLSLLVLSFFGGLFGTLLFGLIRDIWCYGVNSVWRDLVFDLPIPYWMRFVPKWERDL